ncbi:hypothetical protein [Stenomitos frigidus]|uniref:hypothetical protein n=1 Tax=Stenomitos frigidus TaxID=1886765 RepID=UPI0011B1D578|nr:hypothetical protein [Stenomitos frigidus]
MSFLIEEWLGLALQGLSRRIRHRLVCGWFLARGNPGGETIALVCLICGVSKYLVNRDRVRQSLLSEIGSIEPAHF